MPFSHSLGSKQTQPYPYSQVAKSPNSTQLAPASISASKRRPPNLPKSSKPFKRSLSPKLNEFENLADSMPQLVWTAGPDGRVDYYNRRIQDFDGIKKLKSSYYQWSPVVHPDDRQVTLKAWHKAVKTGSTYQVEHRVRLKNKDYHWFLSRAVPKLNSQGQVIKWYGTATDINDTILIRQQAEDLYEHAPVGYHSLDSAGIIQKINQTELDMVGYRRDQVVGKMKFIDLLTAPGQKKFKTLFPQFKKTGIASGLEYDLIKPDGSIISALINAVALYDSKGNYQLSRSTIIDITERKQIESKIRESELSFRTLADSMPQLVWITGPSGVPQYYNCRFLQYTGLKTTTPISQNWKSIIHPHDYPQAHSQWIKSFKNSSSFQCEFRLKSRRGKYRWFLARAFPLKDSTALKTIRWFGTCTDIHAQKRLSQKKDEFINIASHELKTPITSIQNYAQVLEETFRSKGDLASTHLLSHLNSQIHRLTRLLTDILDSTKIHQGKLEYNFSEFDFNSMIVETVDDLRHAHHHRSIRLALGPPVRLVGDSQRLGQVVTNLAVNALKYSDTQKPITISTRLTPRSVSLSVKDQGIGVSPSHLSHLFKPYYRGIRASHTSGLGLGLYISSEIIKRHQGAFSVKSQPRRGSVFTFTLPLSS